MHVPNAGPEVAELEEGFPHEGRADTFKLVARSLARDALANGFSFEQVGNAFGNRLACRVAAIGVAHHSRAVDGQRRFQGQRQKVQQLKQQDIEQQEQRQRRARTY